jgi:hypothetical protein
MQAVSAAISRLGFVVDLMWHREFMRICRQSTARSGGASTSRRWKLGARAREHGGRKIAVAQKKATATGVRGRRRREWGHPRLGSLYL